MYKTNKVTLKQKPDLSRLTTVLGVGVLSVMFALLSPSTASAHRKNGDGEAPAPQAPQTAPAKPPAVPASPVTNPAPSTPQAAPAAAPSSGPSTASNTTNNNPNGLSFSDAITPELKAQILQDVATVSSFQGTGVTPVYQKIFNLNSLDGAGLNAFFASRIKMFDLNACGGGAAAACVIPSWSTTTMWITPMYTTLNIPQAYRISVIFHESRHTEVANNFWSHVDCPTPYLDDNGKDIVGIISGTKMAGLPACDDTPYGAYGLQAVLLKNIEKACGNCNEKLRMDGQLYGDDTINRISDLPSREVLKHDLQGK